MVERKVTIKINTQIDQFKEKTKKDITQIINKLPQEYTKHIKRIIKTYPSIQLFRLKKPGQNIDDIRLLDSSIYVHENGFASNQPGPFVLLTQKDKDQNIKYNKLALKCLKDYRGP